MEFNERKNPPKWLDIPGWPHEINYKSLRSTFPQPVFVVAFGSAIRPPTVESITTRFLFWLMTKKTKRYANDVDFLVVTKDSVEPYALRNGLPYRGYGFSWCDAEASGAMHLQVATLDQLEKALTDKDADARRILSSCEIIEGDVTLAKQLIARATARDA